MKGGIVEINWHDSQPVLTLDFHPKSSLLATGGNDRDIKLWKISSCDSEKKVPRASYHSSLSYHSSAVNTLRFSPSGEQLASGADGGELVIWKLHAMEDGDSWKVSKRLLHHQKDVLDLEWSADGAYIISGSVDNLCIIWDANKGHAHQVLDAHFHYVQGVAWDPLDGYIASVSSDRTCRIYAKKMQGKVKGLHKMTYICQHVITKSELQKPDVSKTPSNKTHLFHDETLPSFFRRLSWSPDGSFLLVPGGIQKFSPASAAVNTAYVISRNDLSRPAIQIPGASKPIVAVRFCPILFQLRESHSVSGFFKLPYRIVFAVATLNSLYVYDTESGPPIAVFAGLHYAAITDIAWSPDGKYLAVSSRDCYCTLVEFENNELGSPVPQHVLARSVHGSLEPTNLKLDERQRMEIDNLEFKLANLGEDVKAVEKQDVLFPEAEKPAGETAEGIQGNVTPNTEIKNAMACTANMMEEKKHALPKPTDNSAKTGKKRITPVAIV